jgi:hypothetical protein
VNNSDSLDEFEDGEGSGMTNGEVIDKGAALDINMVFVLSEEFQTPDDNDVAQICIGAE